MKTWAEFQQLVRQAYWTVHADDDSAIKAIADYVKSEIVREVDGALPLRQSYLNSYKEAALAMAGFRLTASSAEVVKKVKGYLTIDGRTKALANYIDSQVDLAISDFNKNADHFERYLVSGVVDIQRHIPYYATHGSTIFIGEDVEMLGSAMVVVLPSSIRPLSVRLESHYEELAEQAEYAKGDLVLSGRRVYEVVVGGTISAGSLGTGLHSTSGNEVIDGVAFTARTDLYPGGVKLTPIGLNALDEMVRGRLATTPTVWAISRDGRNLYVYPEVPASYHLAVEWSGLKPTFLPGDRVVFDDHVISAVVEYVRGWLKKTIGEDDRGASASLSLYGAMLRKLRIDHQERQGILNP